MSDHLFLKIFPANYFRIALSPVFCFKYRSYLKVHQRLLIVFILYLFLMLPMSWRLILKDSVDVSVYFPKIVEQLKVSHLKKLNQGYQTHQTTVVEEEPIYIAYFNENEKVYDLDSGYFILTPTSLMVSDDIGQTVKHPIDIERLLEKNTLTSFLNEWGRQFLNTNRFSFFISDYLSLSLLLLIHLAILILGVSLLLNGMKHMDQFDIFTFGEANQIILNTMGLPSFLSSLLGWFVNDISMILTLQGLGFLIMLALTYFKTHFNDEKTNNIS